jgi:hypothetical protein
MTLVEILNAVEKKVKRESDCGQISPRLCSFLTERLFFGGNVLVKGIKRDNPAAKNSV